MATYEEPIPHSSLWYSLQLLTNDEGAQRVDLIEMLQGELRELQRCWSINLNNGLHVAQKGVIDNLQAHVRRLQPRRSNAPKGGNALSSEQRLRQYQHGVLVSFNAARGSVYATDGNSNLTKRREWLATSAPGHLRITTRSSRRDLNDAITKIEQQILAQGYVPLALPAESEESSTPELEYVPRLGLYAKIDRLIQQGQRVIGLVGEGGVGKSTLARNYAQERSRDNAYLFADFRSDDDLAISLLESFRRLGVSTTSLSKDSALLRLREYLAEPTSDVRFIILDNLETRSQVERTGPLPNSAIVLITARNEYAIPAAASLVAVGDLTEQEAVTLARSKLPTVSDDELTFLRLLRGRALALDLVCSFLRDKTAQQRRRFLLNLQEQPVWALGLAAGELGRPHVKTIYYTIIADLRSREETADAVQLLELYTLGRIIQLDFAEVLFEPTGTSGSSPSIRAEAREAASVILARYRLAAFHNQYADIHPLTADILADIFKAVLPGLALELIQLGIVMMLTFRRISPEPLDADQKRPHSHFTGSGLDTKHLLIAIGRARRLSADVDFQQRLNVMQDQLTQGNWILGL